MRYAPDPGVRLQMPLGKPFPRDDRRAAEAEQRLRADLQQALEALSAQGGRQGGYRAGRSRRRAARERRAHTVRGWRFEHSPKAIKNTTPLPRATPLASRL